MSIVKGNHAGLGGAGAPGGPLGGGGDILGSHAVDQSLRLDGTSAYLTKNDFSTATNTSKRTFSTWVKRGDTEGVAAYNHIIGAGSSAIDGFGFQSGTAKLQWIQGGTVLKEGVRDLRDTSAWYHFFTTWNATDNELFIYVNGELDYSDTGSLSALSKLGNTGHTTYIGRRSNVSTTYIHGYLAETVFLDGTIGDVNDFGELVNGIWVPKDISAASLTYGTNGFYLDYADNSDLGKDVSGQGNHFTSNNLAAEDQVLDSPTNNFATFNNLVRFSATTDPVFSEGNLKTRPESDGISYNYTGVGSTINVSSGKWYAEFKPTATSGSTNAYIIGIIEQGLDRMTSNSSGSTWDGGYIYGGSGAIQGNGNVKTLGWGDTFTTDDVIGVAIDMDDGKVWFSKNGTFQASGDPAAGTNAAFTTLKTYNDTYSFSVGCGQTSSQYHQYEGNFGQNPSFNGTFTGVDVGTETDGNGIGLFKYAPPSGFLALCTANLPEPAIGPNSDEQADDYFNTVLYTGNSDNDVTVTNTFAADWVWLKIRESSGSTTQHFLQDIVRGFGGSKSLSSSSTGEEGNTGSTQASQNIVTTSSSLRLVSADFTANSKTYVAWTWKAGGTASSIAVDAYSAGVPSIASSVSAAPDAGFSIVSWTGTGANSTIAHGLSEAPELIIVKNRDDTSNWPVYSEFIGAANRLYLDLGNNSSGASTLWNSTAATNQVFSVGTSNLSNGNTDEMIAYCFHSSDICKVGSYVGNANADGTFVYTGFRPAWVLLKDVDSTSDWQMYDSKRYAFNKTDVTEVLEANQTGAETTTINELDLLSNGFKLRSANTFSNKASNFIYLAFAEQPFKYANAR